jgi:hypothetical protein
MSSFINIFPEEKIQFVPFEIAIAFCRLTDGSVEHLTKYLLSKI